MSFSKRPCGCVPDASGYGWCVECVRQLRTKIWHNLTAEQRDYDRKFGGEEIAELDYEYDRMSDGESCSCHINPPCSYCVNKEE